MKVGIVCMAKQENLYIQEWVDWHLNLGFDNIIIVDNNSEDSERVSDVISDERVIIETDYIGAVGLLQTKVYTEMYEKYHNVFDWILYIDVDEFLHLNEKYNNVKDFLNDEIFSAAEIIRVCWKIYNAGGMLDTDGNYNLQERFKDCGVDHSQNKCVKSFINTKINLNNRKIHGHGIYDNTLDARDSTGKKCSNTTPILPIIVHENAYLAHYITKTMGEFVRQKMFRGGINNNPQRYNNKLRYFFLYNRETNEMREYGEWMIENRNKSTAVVYLKHND